MRRLAGEGCIVDFVQNDSDGCRVFLEEFFELGAECGVHVACNFGVAELALGLAFELRLRNLDGDNGGEAFADIVACNLGFFLALGHVLRELADDAGEGCLEARHVCTAVIGVHVVHKAKEVFLVAVIVPHGDFERVLAIGEHQVNGLVKERGAVFVHVANEFRDATGEAERITLLVFGIALVGQRQAKPAHEEGEFAEARGERIVHVNCFGKDCVVRIELDARTRIGHVTGADFRLRATGNTLGEFLLHDLPVTAHRNDKLVRKRVHAAHAHAVQTGRNLVGVAVELTTGMQLGHDDFDGADVFLRVDIGRDAASVVGHADAVPREDGNFDMVAKTGQRLVYGVVDDFPHQVVQAADIGRTDVHCRAYADGFQSLQDGNARPAIIFFCCFVSHAF